jgi:glyoxylase-like metal-dependent hydrolase (beta-lactamase superfamily II)
VTATTSTPAFEERATFEHGAFYCTVISDGVIQLGPARESFPHADPAEVDGLLRHHYLPVDTVLINQNILIVDTGEHRIMFDTGVGTDPGLGRAEFGPGTGTMLANLTRAGIQPADIDIVALTHAHPDHSWGLTYADGSRAFPNATVAMGEADYTYWTDLSHVEAAPTPHQKSQFRGAHKNLTPYADRLILLRGDEQIVPGVRAIATPGHSPGHLVYEISSCGETMICWGDLCHHEVLLLQRPDWSFMFDYDGRSATQQRLRIYDLVHRNRLAVFGYHFPFPGLGHLRQEADGYAWVPTDLQRRRCQTGRC